MDSNIAQKKSAHDRMTIPAVFHPDFRTQIAIQNGVEKNLIFRTWGGIGDQICAEPTLRFAFEKFKDCRISLASERPELFSHLPFHKVFDLKELKPNYENYLVFETITPPDDSNMVWLFMSHLLTNCVDFPSLCALRSQLPVANREVKMPDTGKPVHITDRSVVVHPGRHWQSKTFPKLWWDDVLFFLKDRGITPILIGGDADDNRGTVNVDTAGCLDLRNQLSVMDSISLLKRSKVLITNDSSPLHMAVDSDCTIGFLATCKHPDMIKHWRRGKWGWRMENLSLGGIWDHVDYCPNSKQKIEVEFVDPELLKSWLPDPASVALWAENKLKFKQEEPA